MALFPRVRPSTWLTVVIAGVVVAAAAGVYFWRFAGPDLTQADGGAVVAGNGSGRPLTSRPGLDGSGPQEDKRQVFVGAESDGAGAARRDSVSGGARANGEALTAESGVSPLVTANAPPWAGQAVEMRLAELAAQPTGGAEGVEDFKAAKTALQRGDLRAARIAFSAGLRRGLPIAEAEQARAELHRMADAVLFSRALIADDPLIGTHVVASGEVLQSVARQYRITDELLASINQIVDPHRIQVGARLKVIRGPFQAVISKADHRMEVYLADILVRTYRVGLGTDGGTPIGTWKVSDKLRDPDWTDPVTGHHYRADDPQNPVGERWIGLQCVAGECLGRVGFGIHGTIDPASIGENMSMGCIRMLPEDIGFVFDLFVPNESTVIIRP